MKTYFTCERCGLTNYRDYNEYKKKRNEKIKEILWMIAFLWCLGCGLVVGIVAVLLLLGICL